MKPDEPKQPLRWMANVKPDKPGIWAVKGKVRDYVHFATEADVKDEREFSTDTWCYLGPLPEILPPVKKVTERLWIKCGQRYATDSAEYMEAWIAENERTVMKDVWIRTDCTREREV